MISEKKPDDLTFESLLSDSRSVDLVMGEAVSDPKLRVALIQEQRRLANEAEAARLAETQRATVAEQKHAPFIPHGREKGSPNNRTIEIREHIRALRKAFPGLPNTRLVEKADPAIKRDMANKTFYKHVLEVEREI